MSRPVPRGPVSGLQLRRRSLNIGTALGGTMALALAIMPGLARADDECGAAPADSGSVICTSAGNPYANGITYVAPPADLTIVLQDGVVVDTSGGLNIGVLALGVGDTAIAVTGGTNTAITTDAQGAFGVLAASTYGDLTVNADRVITTGDNATGIVATTSEGVTNVTANVISTAGSGANGIDASTDTSMISIDAGTITTLGANANGVIVASDFGDIMVTTDAVTTSGDGAFGILATNGGPGTITINGGTIMTGGAGASAIRSSNDTGGINASADMISTSGSNAIGIDLVSGGAIGIDAGSIMTTGTGAYGIQAQATGGATIAFASVSTTGDNAVGVLVPQGALFFGPRATTDVAITGGSVSTSGANADAVQAIASTGMANIALTGTVSTTGANSRGVFATGPMGVSVTGGGAFTTTGDGSNAIEVSSTAGPVTVVAGNIATSGALSGGVRATGGTDADVSVTTGTVATTNVAGSNYSFLPNSTAIVASAAGTGNVAVNSGAITTAGQGARGIAATAADGEVTVTSAGVTTSGARANGIDATSGTGNVLVTTTGTVSTSGDQSSGIYAVSYGGNAVVNAADVATTGFAANGIVASGATGATATFGTASTTGTFATTVFGGSDTGDVVISGTNASAAGASATAIYGVSSSGDVAITTTGNVASTGRGGSGIIALSDTGDVSVTANNVSTIAALADDEATSRSAIQASGASATVVVTGSATGRGRALYGGSTDVISVAATAGDANVTVNSATSAGETARAIGVTSTGNATLVTTGAVSASGAMTEAISLQSGGAASVTLGGTTSSTTGNGLNVDAGTTAALNLGTGATLSGGMNGATINSVGGTTVVNAGTIGGTMRALDISGGAATIQNSGRISGNIALTEASDVVSNSGIFDATGFSLFGAGDDRFDNGGLYNVSADQDFGAGSDVFNNSGRVLVRPGATVAGNVSLLNLEAFNNSGLVDLRNGVGGDTLTLGGTYVGSGNAQLGLDITPGTTTAADRLVLAGAASGSTGVLLNPLGTNAPRFNQGTVVVQAGAASSAGAFTVAPASANAGLVQYQIVYNPTDFSYALTAAPNAAAFRTLNYVEGVRNLWLKSADVVSGQLRAQRDALWSAGDGAPSGKFWMQMHGSTESRDGARSFGSAGQAGVTSTGFDQDYFGGQVGFDFGGGSGERGGFAVGVTGGYINSSQNFARSADRIKYDVVNGGVYASYTSGNLFINALGKYDYYWADTVSQLGGFRNKANGDSYGARGEVGFRFGGDSFFVEPAASLSYVKSRFDDFSVLGTTVSFDDDDGLRGRAGARLGGNIDLGGQTLAVYAGGNYIHEFKGEDRTSFGNAGGTFSFTNARLGDYGEGIFGVNITQSEAVSGFIEGSYIRSFNDNDDGGEIEGAGGRAGLRIRF